MKKTYIAAIVLVAIALGIIFTTLNDSGTFANFAQAKESPNKTVQVVGKLLKNKPMAYNPQKNANLFTFYMKDKAGNECQVFYQGTKPQDFIHTDQIVLTGEYKNNAFYASKMLMKCPSKYNKGKPVDGNMKTRTITSEVQN